MTSTEAAGSSDRASEEKREGRKRRAILDELTAQAEELGLYDDSSGRLPVCTEERSTGQSQDASAATDRLD